MIGKTHARLALVAGCCFALPAAAQDLVILNARILDGTGNEIPRGTVVVRDGRIAAVGANASGAAATNGSVLSTVTDINASFTTPLESMAPRPL